MKRILLPLLLVGVSHAFSGRAAAEIIYVTGEFQGFTYIARYKFGTFPDITNALVHGTVAEPSGLVFDTHGRIIYTVSDSLGHGEVLRFNPRTNTDETLATGLTNPRQLALEPGGKSVLVSESGFGGRIDRINLQTKALSVFSNAAMPFGQTYDGSGRLFAVLNNESVARLDPTTGAILQQSPNLAFVKSLTFDPSTDSLYTSAFNKLYRFDPNDLSTVNTVDLPGFTGATIVADGKGFCSLTTDSSMSGTLFIGAMSRGLWPPILFLINRKASLLL